ncbi:MULTISPECIES: ethanolamine ammonia-lyase subunit EutC [unclassified Bradyrhizobium]|uniref:ethanolamine ammonia-lyase subunit EutC n=1 Tax=unclassified Bradyrhizobium TaxID=2631580 RepID=UPI000482FECE|nr:MULTISPECIES: ethanolamine ammonia-lyase subunit EutC [unclassified Bradyrhizobium]MCP3458853.1 ethanolamine ammonia-lyase subunit EutC [Bradyrhizobium sp. CCGUVB23]
MSSPAVPSRPTLDLRTLTPARVALGRSGASLPTKPLLDFTLDHARARDAVHAVFDVERMIAELAEFGVPAVATRSRAADRGDYLRRPDLGRQLEPTCAEHLASRAADPGRLVIVIGDGLSPTAVHAHAIGLLRALLPDLADTPPVAVDHIVVASGARVALGDEIGAILGAAMVVMLIGERPGLSAPDSLGAYLTFAPKPGRTDAERNCVSNIHRAGLSCDEAAFKIAWLVRAGLSRDVTGVALKDESGDLPARIGTALPE